MASNPANDFLDAEVNGTSVPGVLSADTAPEGSNPADTFLQTEQASLRASSLRSALDVNGGQFARSRLVEGITGVPAAVAIRNPDVEKRAKLKEMEILLRDAPELAKKYVDPDFAKLAHDDIQPLTGIEKAARTGMRVGQAAAAAVPSIEYGLYGALAAFLRNAGLGPLSDVGQVLAEGAQGQALAAKDRMQQAQPDLTGVGPMEAAVYSGVTSLAQNMLLAPLYLTPGGAPLALGAMGATTGGQEYIKAKQAGLPEWMALGYGGVQGAVEVVTEKLPLDKFIKDLQESVPLWKMLMHNLAREVPGEEIATLLQDFNEWAVLNPGKPFAQYVAERPSAAAQTFIATLIGSGGQVTLAKGLDTALGTASQKMESDQGKVDRALQNNEVAATLRAFTEQSKLADRDPKAMADVINKAAQGTSMETVYVDAKQFSDALAQSGINPEQLLSAIPQLREQLPEAMVTNGDVELPIGELLAYTKGTPLAELLTPISKFGQEELTPAEAQAWSSQAQQLFQAEVDAQAEQGILHSSAEQEAKTVGDAVLAQLESANRFTPDVNATYAALARDFYVTMASRLGITPTELLQRYPLRAVAENVAQDVLNQVERGQMPAPVANQRVTVGEREMKASDAMAAVDKEDSALQKLLDCLSR